MTKLMTKLNAKYQSAFLVLILTATAVGGNLTSPYVLETAQVLPQGVRNPRLLNVRMFVSEKYNKE